MDDSAFIRAMCAAPNDPLPVLVYADFLEEQGIDASSLRALNYGFGCLLNVKHGGHGNYGDGGFGLGYGYGNYGDGGFGLGYGYGSYGDGGPGSGGGYGDGGGGPGDGYGGYADGGHGDGHGGHGNYGDGGYGGYGDDTYTKTEDWVAMTNGFQILSVKSGYSPYVLIGEVTVQGLDVEIRNCRVIRRFGNSRSLANLAVNGPAEDTQLLAPSEVEYLWRPDISRAIPANKSVWETHLTVAG